MTAVLTNGPVYRNSTDALDPRKSMPDYRLEIYNMLQLLDEQQEAIEHKLATCSDKPLHRTTMELDEDDEDDFVVVEDFNRPLRRKQLLSQLQQLWRTREAIRQRAKHLNIRIDSLQHGRHASLMSFDDDAAAQQDTHVDEI